MKVTIVHADTCLSDYWGGHHLPHVSVCAYRRSFASIRREILSEVSNGYIAGDVELLSRVPMSKIRAAVRRDIRPAKKGDRLAFRDIQSDEAGDMVQAYFVFIIED